MQEKNEKPFPSNNCPLFQKNRRKKLLLYVYLVLLLLTVAVALYEACLAQWENALLALLALLLYFIPPFVEKIAKIELPPALEILALIFVFASQILGEIANFYERVPIWDTLLHSVSGFMFAAFGFSLVDMLNRDRSKSRALSPICLAFIAFSFSMTVGVSWEFIEFSIDTLFEKDMQKDTLITSIYSIRFDPERRNRVVSLENIAKTVITMTNESAVTLKGYLDIGLIDTMKDLFLNFIGALSFSAIGIFYGKSRLIRLLVPRYTGQGEKPPDPL